jgi:prepilin-type N-terminal cleavage/methylation domain-containing protein
MKNAKRGFTVPELLVVIAIIVFSLSVCAALVPSLDKAQESAKRALCANGLRQIGAAVIMYANTYDNLLPADYYLFPGQSKITVEGHTYCLYRDTWKDATGKLIPFRFAYLFETGFIAEPKLFYCPSNESWMYRYESYIDPPPWGSLPQKVNFPPPIGHGNSNQWVRMGYSYYPTDPDPNKFDEMTEAPTEATTRFDLLNSSIPYTTDNIWTRADLSHKSGIRKVRERGVLKIILFDPGVNALFKDGHVVYCADPNIFQLRLWDFFDPPGEPAHATVKYPEFYYKIFKTIAQRCP